MQAELEKQLKALADAGAVDVPGSRSGNHDSRGFVKWANEGEYLRGVIGDKWQSKNGEVLNVTITKDCTPSVVSKGEDGGTVSQTAKAGEVVYVGVSNADLKNRDWDSLAGHEVFIAFTGTKQIKQGKMKEFLVRDCGADKDSPPF